MLGEVGNGITKHVPHIYLAGGWARHHDCDWLKHVVGDLRRRRQQSRRIGRDNQTRVRFGFWHFGADDGQTENATLVSLPGGVQAIYSTGTLRRFRFPDWQGTIRAESEPASRTFSESLAFAPFGERYALKGTPYNVDSFTGKPDQLVSDEYDFPAREEHNADGWPTLPE